MATNRRNDEKRGNAMKQKNESVKMRPLFCLRMQREGPVLPQKLQGTFLIDEKAFPCFAPKEPARLRLPYCKERGKYSNRLVPLLEYLAREGLDAVITGTALQEENLYAVTSVELEDADSFAMVKRKMTSDGLRACIDRLLAWDLDRTDQRTDASTDLYYQPDLEAYFTVCRHTFPEWLSNTAQRNLNIARSGSSHARDHAYMALRYLLNIDWSPRRIRVPDAGEARSRLDRMLFGMEEVKTRILETLTHIRRTGTFPRWGILLTGPAGSGKTCVAKAFAELIGLPVILLDMSVIGREVEPISGSSRIYKNARPGDILSRMFDERSAAGVLLINELDKAFCAGQNGESRAANALLSLLDKQGFRENFLEALLPVDQLFAIATCNSIDCIPAPIRDRFCRIDLPAYNAREKAEIWKRHVVPDVAGRFHMRPDQMSLMEDALETLTLEYAVEPGVRDLEQYAERLAAVTEAYLDEKGEDYTHTYDKAELTKLLGPGKAVKRYFAVHPGEVNSFFFHGGAAYPLRVEAQSAPGNGEFRVLGPVAELHREYIRVAYESIRSTVKEDFSKLDISVFIPDRLPDSARNCVGCAAYAAICGLLCHMDLQPMDTAFIGGVDLNGNLYFDEANIVPLLKALPDSGIQTLYSPVGVSEMIAKQGASLCGNLQVIEAYHARDLVALAVSR